MFGNCFLFRRYRYYHTKNFTRIHCNQSKCCPVNSNDLFLVLDVLIRNVLGPNYNKLLPNALADGRLLKYGNLYRTLLFLLSASLYHCSTNHWSPHRYLRLWFSLCICCNLYAYRILLNEQSTPR